VHIGHYISGSGHVALIGWLIFGNVFAAEPLPMQVASVSVVTGEQYAAAIAAFQSPQSTTEVAQPETPDAPDTPAVVTEPDAPAAITPPVQAETPPTEEAPEVMEQALPQQAEVSDTAPELPEPPAEVAVLVPEVADRAVPKPAERIAPEAVSKPDPEALPDPVVQEAVQKDQTGELPKEPTDATAPEEAATEIVTEAEKPASTLTESKRPPARRPEAPVKVAQPDPKPAATPNPEQKPAPDTSDAVNAALNEALASASSAPAAASVPSGPPLSAGEKDALRVAVSSCWNVGSLSTDALQTTVVVTVSMSPDARPLDGSIRMASYSGGTEGAARQAFEAARRAIIRCGARGYGLPTEKYGQWQEIEMTFNPERMRIK